MSFKDIGNEVGADSKHRKGKGKGNKNKNEHEGNAKKGKYSKEDFADTEYNLSGDETIANTFDTPSSKKRRLKGEKTAIYGKTGTGKTRWLTSWVRLNPKDVQEDIEAWNLPAKKHDFAVERMLEAFKNKEIIRGDPLIILGTEISTEDCLYGDDQWDMVAEHVDHDIFFKEVYRTFESGPEMGEEDPIASLREFNKHWAIILKDSPQTGTVGVDSGTQILMWRHAYIRRKVMHIPVSAKEQGVPAKYWFWRNEKMESFQLGLRAMAANTVVTWKMAKDKEGEETDKPRWHDDTSGHLSNNNIQFPLHEKDIFSMKIIKCRQSRALRLQKMLFPTATKFIGLLVHAFTIEDLKGLKI